MLVRSGSPCATASRRGSSATPSAARSRTTMKRASTPIPISARTTRSTCRRWPRCRRCKTTSSSRTICWIRCERVRSQPGSSSCRHSSRTGCETPSPSWFRDAAVLNRIENYLHSGTSFAYLQVALTRSNASDAESRQLLLDRVGHNGPVRRLPASSRHIAMPANEREPLIIRAPLSTSFCSDQPTTAASCRTPRCSATSGSNTPRGQARRRIC